MARTIFFDLDGVLIDSRPGIVTCINDTLEALGLEAFAAADLERVIGPPLQIGFATLLAERGADASLVPRCIARFRDAYATASLGGGSVLQPGIAALLEGLSGRAVLAVATSKQMRFAEPILLGLGIRDAFRSVTGPTPDTDGECKTATLNRAVRGLAGTDIAASWMVGDRSHDVVAALAIGVVPVGVTWGYGSEAELREAGAHEIVRDPGELLARFDAWETSA